jgi:hypothetical protein
MSITSGAAALVRLAQARTKDGARGGRALRNAVLMAGVPAAYVAGSRKAAADSQRAQHERLAELERRLEQLELAALASSASSASSGATGEPRRLHAVGTEPTVDKVRAASHYEVLATQLACERQIVEIEDRLAAVERIDGNRAPRPVWLASSNGTATEFRRRG